MSLLDSTSKEKELGNQISYFFILFAIIIISIESCWKYESYVKSTLSPSISSIVALIFQLIYKTQQALFDFNFLSLHSSLLVLYAFIALVSPNKPDLKANRTKANSYVLIGLFFWVLPFVELPLNDFWGIIFILFSGYFSLFLVVKGGLIFNSIVHVPENDLFNERNEQFPQNEILLENEFSVGFKTHYLFENKWREGVIPVVYPQRGVLVAGSPGSGKTFSILIPALWQSIYKGYCGVIYDYKFPDMTLETYNALQKAKNYGRHKKTDILPELVIIDFENLQFTQRCNPFQQMNSIDDAAQLSKTLLLNLNKSWIKKEGDFWITSAVNYLTSALWFLRIMEKNYPTLGSICDLPHAIELINKDPQVVFPIIERYNELSTYSSMFVLALKNKADTQLAGQIATIQAALVRLSSPNIYWVMSGENIELKANDPKAPKIFCLGNTPMKSAIYGAALSVYMTTLMKNAYAFNEKKCAFFIDELPSMYLLGLDEFIATIRSYKVATWLGIQDMEQLVKSYGQDAANVVINTCGTLFSGAVNAKSAETISKLFGKTNQNKVDTSFAKNDLNFSYVNQLQDVVPASKIATLSQGYFVGKVADTFEQPIALKLFKSYVHVETNELKKKHKTLPLQFKGSSEALQSEVQKNYLKIKSDIQKIIDYENQKSI